MDKKDKIVLFLGRFTMQKGPEYFLAAAKKVLDVMDNVKFVMHGSGNMARRIAELAANLGIGHKVLFSSSDVNKAYQMADLYVVPSVCEPFGIAALEAMNRNVPVLINSQRVGSEAVENALKVNFRDIDEMAGKMIAILQCLPRKEILEKNGPDETSKLKWEDSAAKVVKIYEEVVAQKQGKES